jgi:hypothetical protein
MSAAFACDHVFSQAKAVADSLPSDAGDASHAAVLARFWRDFTG